MEYLVRTQDFEGPLDLLLHLVKEANISIYDINIVDITDQYLDYINHWQELNINVASEYLVMAATLMEIKSKSLLPREEREIGDDEDVIDSREAFIQKLAEYERYKKVTGNFKSLELNRRDFYTKAPERLHDILHEKIVNDTDTTVDDLAKAFADFLKRKDMEKPIRTKVTNKEYSIKKRKDDIKKVLLSKKRVVFSELFDKFNKSYVIVTFLAILELAKEDKIILVQDENFSEIMIEQKV